MNKDIFEGKWKEIRGDVKWAGGKLTDDELDQVAGQFDKLVGLVQEKYGYSKQQVKAEIDKIVKKMRS
jgi:Uncharacterized protein conserved in bacteria